MTEHDLEQSWLFLIHQFFRQVLAVLPATHKYQESAPFNKARSKQILMQPFDE